MAQQKAIAGFSKWSADEKLNWLKASYDLPEPLVRELQSHRHPDPQLQELYEQFSENTVSNFFVPYGLAPNFLVNGKWYVVPMAIEESSVVAAASHAAKFWSAHGGFTAVVDDPVKVGQVHFIWTGDNSFITSLFGRYEKELVADLDPITASMKKRGGGIKAIRLVDKTGNLDHYYQLHVDFRTADAMGANFINTVLEALAGKWKAVVEEEAAVQQADGHIEINMAILSNYTPESLVKVSVETEVSALGIFDPDLPGKAFAEKFVRAVEIAEADPYRAVTHNKGIFNGMDGVVIATGNDFRAVEACGHAYAARDGQYRGLSSASVSAGTFRFGLEVPMSVGTVGGLTTGHPLARASLKIMQEPNAAELMMIIGAAGLANNFSAVRSLITSGIQKGHMKMHLTNILRQLGATDAQKQSAIAFFRDKTVSYAEVKNFISGQI
jgi:hydroxymethylglutaryl-CoA reductase